jgi:tyrosine-protein kinase
VSPLGEERREGTPTRYLDALREHWLLVVFLVVVGVGFTIAYLALAQKRYEASADLLVTPISSSDETLVGFNLLRESADPSRSVLTAARLVKTPEVADAVKARLGWTTDREALLNAVSVQPVGQADILSIVGKASTASQAARIANAFASELIRERTQQFQAQLNNRIARLKGRLKRIAGQPAGAQIGLAVKEELATLSPFVGQADPTLHIASPAVPPQGPSSPRPVLSVLIALFASLLLGIAVAVWLEVLNPRVNREEELLFVHRLPVLARVPRMSRKQVDDYLAGRGKLPGEVWEAYRMLRANLATAGPEGTFPQTILMTSAIRGEGKTMSTLNLAISLANAGASVIAVDGDLRRPMLATVFGVARRANSFADVFMKDAPPVAVGIPGSDHDIRLVLSSPGEADLVDLLDPTRIERGLDRLKQAADVIIIDSSALTEVADALAFAETVDAVLVVTRLGHTRPDELSQLLRTFAYRKITPTGFIVTNRRAGRASRYGYRATKDEKVLGPPASEPAKTRALKPAAKGRRA